MILEVAISQVEPEVPFCVIGLGRFGGGELSYQSDLDVIFVHANLTRKPPRRSRLNRKRDARTIRPIESGASNGCGRPGRARRREVAAASSTDRVPPRRIFNVDLGLRPEGGQGRLSPRHRRVRGLFRALGTNLGTPGAAQGTGRRRGPICRRPIHGMARRFVWEPPIGEDEVAEIRRMKARIERERIPAARRPAVPSETRQGISVGRGVDGPDAPAASRGRVGAGTMDTLAELERTGADRENPMPRLYSDSYSFCEHTRNRWHLVGALRGGASPGDSLPAQAHQMSRLARSLGTTPPTSPTRTTGASLVGRAGVMERLFYGIEGPGGFAAKR